MLRGMGVYEFFLGSFCDFLTHIVPTAALVCQTRMRTEAVVGQTIHKGTYIITTKCIKLLHTSHGENN